ncbi:type II/IV secretion system protein [uncultured Eubacterium sp.]|uniref:GspE/PulE family protein n=1 Tax=uncultured Eubacterium sp. TaxID=165185 RepID=UPI0025E2BA9C|nr:type II/IV secretion system protein [uncultured Eubacterium sp.]
MNTNLRIGDILVEKGYVTEAQMQQALVWQKEHRDKRVGQILMELGFVSETQVLDALASRLHLEIIDVAQQNVELQAVGMVNRELCEKNLILPLSVQGHNMTIVTNDPLNYFALEEVRQQTSCQLQIYLSEEKPLRKAVSYYFAEVSARKAATQANVDFAMPEAEELTIEDLGAGDDEAPIIRLLNSLIERAIKSEASDIHIEPFETETKVRMRIDGVIMEYVTIQRHIHAPLIARIKILSNLDIAEKRIPQDGHFRVNLEGGSVNIRVSVLPTVFGEKAVLRIMAATTHMDHADHFGMDDYSYNQFAPMLNRPNGIIYITGPTGSGKSTTLYMVLDYLSGRNVNISTIEDPVEKNMPGINQTQVNPVAGLTFDVGLRALMRQDPDIIMVGETRDGETAGTSVRAAITGHVVLSTLHTNDAVSSIVRLEDMGVETYLVANSLVGLVAQRLMRKVCPKCGVEMETTEEEQIFLGEDVKKVRRGVGCAHCNHTGYSGRIAVHEIVSIDSEIRRMIINHNSVEEITAYAKEHQHMRTLKESGLNLVKEGVTTPEELLKISYQ